MGKRGKLKPFDTAICIEVQLPLSVSTLRKLSMIVATMLFWYCYDKLKIFWSLGSCMNATKLILNSVRMEKPFQKISTVIRTANKAGVSL